MITWRDDGERSSAFIGECMVGHVWQYNDARWAWIFYPFGGNWDTCGTAPAAKSALEAAVAEWVRRAGLTILPEGHVVVPREPTETMAKCEAIRSLETGPATRRWHWIWSSLIEASAPSHCHCGSCTPTITERSGR